MVGATKEEWMAGIVLELLELDLFLLVAEKSLVVAGATGVAEKSLSAGGGSDRGGRDIFFWWWQRQSLTSFCWWRERLGHLFLVVAETSLSGGGGSN